MMPNGWGSKYDRLLKEEINNMKLLKEQTMNNKINEINNELKKQKQDLLDLTKRYVDLNANYNKAVVELQERERLGISNGRVVPFVDGFVPVERYNCRVDELNDAIKEVSKLKSQLTDAEADISASNNALHETNKRMILMKVQLTEEACSHANTKTQLSLMDETNRRLGKDNQDLLLKLAESKVHNGWTLTSESLPTLAGRVLVICNFKNKSTGQVDRVVRSANYFKARGFEVDGYNEDVAKYWTLKVESWQKAPEINHFCC